ncbi:3'-5' exoribonuclease HELZ2-like isoform X3 [Dysidea avara]|uniref:3'-5' exoribonuclease HELZ2-like isoform X3 n=1 Tax=Dysidea avara TaxID=196820 RepID=UPI0033219875
MAEVCCEVCWTCYQFYTTAEFALTLWSNGCSHPYAHHWWNGGIDHNSVMVTYHEESGLLLRPFPENTLQFYGNFRRCCNDPCPRPQCTYAHNDLELSEWNREKQAKLNHRRRPPRRPPRPPHQPNLGGASLTTLEHKPDYELPPESELKEDLLTQPLTRENYVDKFHTLLYYEEHEHERVLKERCDQPLDVFLFDEEGERYGSLVGLDSDDVAYIQQNAVCAEIKVDDTIRISAEVFKYNLSYDELDVVHVKFTDEEFCVLKSKIEATLPRFAVHFILKHSYYCNLHRSLDRLTLNMIKRLIPFYPPPQQKKLPKVNSYNLLDKEYQMLALKKIMACDSSVPFLVTGPFGTGKTRLLVTAAVKFLEIRHSRVLICTSHLKSADTYIDNYFGPMLEDGFIRCSVKRLTTKDYVLYHGHYRHLFTDGYEERERNEIRKCRLIITTFLKAPHLSFYKGRPFTHILIDEGAQTREPEAIAPLGLADDNTKIVIAGDHLQIGPQVLVAGKEACNELRVSLLQRLHDHSTSSGPKNSYTALLLTNYRCHGSILRLPSYLFYNSTLHTKSDVSLHPKTSSALAFVCTSVDSTITTSKEDFSQEEARTILEQVRNYINPWPVEWDERFLSTVCVVASSRNQVRMLRKLLNRPNFKEIKGIKTSTTYELQGREFRAIFISTLEKTEDDGSTSNQTKSICNQYVFNTVITRAQSLVVCVGNPFLLFSIEKSTPGYSIYCWREYVKRCLETSSLQLTPQCYEVGESFVQESIRKLYSEVYGDLYMSLDHCSPCSEVSDSILQAYRRIYQKELQNKKVMLKSTENGDSEYVLQKGHSHFAHEAPEGIPMEGPQIECYLECKTYRNCTAIPLNAKELPITIQGINNRRCALEGAQVKVGVYKDSDRCGRVCEVVEQGPQRQFVCRVNNYNAIFLYPIDRKNPKLLNLPRLSREILNRVSDPHKILEGELKKSQHAVTVFDPASFHKDGKMIDIPQIKDVIPLSIAQNLLFVVWYLRWGPKYRYPLGVVVAAIPKGFTLYHGKQLLLAHHHINTAPVDGLDDGEDLAIATPEPRYDHAFTIDPPEAKAFDDALTLEPVASDDGKCYQLGVHITNVGGAVRKESVVDVGAVERATSVYGSTLSKIYYPLLPERVRNTLSLSRGKEAPVISYTCQVRIDNDNVSIVSNTINIYESCVKSRARLTYEEAQHLLTGVYDASLAEKVTYYNNTLPRNCTFRLKQRLTLLLQISESFFRNRMQSNDMDYSIEDADKLSSPQAHFLVSELMIWANRIAAEHILTAFPQLALLRRQKPPNQEQLERVLEKCKDIVAHSPVHKALADNMDVNVPINTKSVMMMEATRKQLYGALQSGNLLKAQNLLRTVNYHPQLAVICKEVNGTKCRAEYVCSSMLQQQKPLLLDNGSYLVSLPQDEKEVYGHNDLCCLYTHSTSPLRRYIDILVQRLILQSLHLVNNNDYSAENLVELCVKCNIKTLSGKKFEKDYNCLSIALSLAKCSQTCMVYVTSVERALNFVIQELDYHCLSTDQRSFRLSSITSNAKPQAAATSSPQDDDGQLKVGRTHSWIVKLTSFTDNELVLDKLENVKKYKVKSEQSQTNSESSDVIQDARLTFYLPTTPNEQAEAAIPDSSDSDNHTLGLIQRCYSADFLGMTTSLRVEDWKKVTDFMKLPSPDTGNQLKNLLSSYQRQSNNVNNDVFPQNASFILYEVKQSFKIYESFKASFTASYSDHILSPCIQLLEVAPMLNMCVQHSTKPADCFSSPILSHASKEKYNGINEYIELWESVLLAEAAAQSVGEAEIQLIQNVPLEWPELYPSTSLDDVYYSPYPNNASIEQRDQHQQQQLLLQTTTEFEERCHDYFDLRVGNLVCARYNIPLGKEKEVDGRKVTTANAVYHFIITRIEYEGAPNEDDPKTPTTSKRSEKQHGKYSEMMSKQKIYLKFANKNTARVSPFMRQYLKDSTCEIQVIALDFPYRRMYKSLLALRTTKNFLCKEIALGNMTRRNAARADQKLTQIRQDPLVYELWSDRQRKRLNEVQARSVEIAMRNKFQLIQGPPGTGKSVTGAHLAYASIRSNSGFTSNPRSTPDEKIRCVMYCGPSNKSVDVVLDMFLKHPNVKDLRILRIYSKSIETKSYYGPHSNKALSKPRSEQECREVHELYALHKKIRCDDCVFSERILALERKFERYSKENKFPSPFERKQFYAVIKEAEATVIREGNYQIVFCTCSEASSVRVVDNIKPTHLIIDEAAMATEPEAMIPIQLADHVTLIGDHQQLQPVINYFAAKENGLGRSLFERYAEVLKEMKSSLLHMLTIQYRMHEVICEFPSEEFYDGELRTDRSVAEQFCPIDGFWPNGPECPVVFCDVEGKEKEGSSDHKVHQESKSNKIEAEKIVEIIVALKQAILQSIKKKNKDLKIAVLTPYKAQKYLVQDLLKKERNLLKDLEKKMVTVGTINESQGSEFDFVIFSTVRSMPCRSIKNKAAVQPDRLWITDHLGFITDRHQICVAITRAKHGLVIVGNGMLLRYDGTWDRLLKHYEEIGCVVKPTEFPLPTSSST